MDKQKLKLISIEKNVSTLRDKTLDYLINLIKKFKIENILEIGAGVGYSSYNISLIKDTKIISLEKNKQRYELALENVKAKNVNYINIDAFEYETNQKFDLIILDGPKNNQIKLFNKYQLFLKKNGLIFIDNIFLYDVRKKEMTKNRIKLLNSNNEFIIFLQQNDKFNIKFYNFEDGFAICQKK